MRAFCFVATIVLLIGLYECCPDVSDLGASFSVKRQVFNWKKTAWVRKGGDDVYKIEKPCPCWFNNADFWSGKTAAYTATHSLQFLGTNFDFKDCDGNTIASVRSTIDSVTVNGDKVSTKFQIENANGDVIGYAPYEFAINQRINDMNGNQVAYLDMPVISFTADIFMTPGNTTDPLLSNQALLSMIVAQIFSQQWTATLALTLSTLAFQSLASF
eukprot:TRINITY_DN3073_c0_g1_i1.p1 TRINITY_DN3073_c0_g1~~TRINITY_DN3073_c0_g1_i1.p1  ORF type:complete len:215 (+),score=30.96 TRINITY_DN3073_c0_g1_i1:75-719(+)